MIFEKMFLRFVSPILHWTLHVFFNWARDNNFVNCGFIIVTTGLRLYSIHILLFIKIVHVLTLLSSLSRRSFKTLFVRGLAIISIVYIKSYKLILSKTASFLDTFLILRLKIWWVVSPLAKYDAMSKAKHLFAYFD